MQVTILEPTPRRRGRPPKSANPPLDTRTALIRAGMALLTEKGFHSTGLDEFLERAGVTKGSFYHCFASKDAFGLAVIDAYADFFARKLDRALLRSDRRPLDRIADFVADARAGMARHQFRRGCLIGNLGQDSPALPAAYRNRLEMVFLDWQARLAGCLELACNEGSLADSTNCAELAEFFWIGWEGAVLRSKLMASPRPLDVFSAAFFASMPR